MKRIAVLLTLVLCLSACSAAAQIPPCPPESILYLGGAPILDEFQIEGGPSDPDGGTSIVIRSPVKLEKEGFHFAVVGFYEDETQVIIFSDEDIAPMNYYVISEEEYRDYTKLILFLDYTWDGTLMSQRIVDLLTGEDQSSVTKEFDIIEQPLPAEPTTPPIITDFTPYEALISFDTEPNWLARSLGCLYDSPAEIDMNYMFYLGVNHPGSWADISDESRQTLIDAGFIEEMDIQIMPAELLEEALQSTFGMGLGYMEMPEEWAYIYNEDAFCSNHNDAYFPGVPTITAVEDDGHFITIRYTIEGYWVPGGDCIYEVAPLVLSLVRNEDGTIHALSNLLES